MSLPRWQQRLRRVRRVLQAVLATGIILLALLVGLCQLLLPWVVHNPAKVSAFLSSQLGRPVTIAQVDGQWQSTGPLLSLYGVHVGAGNEEQQDFDIPQAELALDFFAWMQRNRSWSEFRLIGLDLSLQRNGSDGPWELQGFGGETHGKALDGHNTLFQLGAVVVKNLRLRLDDVSTQQHRVLSAEELRLVNSGKQHRLFARVHYLDTPTPPLTIVAHYDESDRSGQLYVGGDRIDLASILYGLDFQGLQLSNGQGQVQLWANWQTDKLETVRLEVDLNELVFESAQSIVLSDKEQVAPHVGFDQVRASMRWQRAINGWTFDLADFSYTRGGIATAPSSLHLEIQRNQLSSEELSPKYLLRADVLNLAPLVSVAMLSNALPAQWRRWLYAADPQGRVHDLSLHQGETDFALSARLEGITWHAALDKPGMRGLSGVLLGDQNAFALTLPTHQAFSFELPRVFRKPLEFSEFSGVIAAYRRDTAWCIETEALTFDSAGYGGELRGSVALQDDGTRPLIDVAAWLQHGEVTAAPLFWPTNVMPPPVVKWLDRALMGGKLRTARLVFRGDADDWPFRKPTGRFEARGEFENMTLNYHPEWPPAEHLQLTTTFVNDSLRFNANAGEVSGNKITTARGELPNMGEGQIDLNLEGNGSGKNLLELVKASPIGQRYAAQLLGVDIGGQGQVELHLYLPIKQMEQMRLEGGVALTDANLRAAQWNLNFDQANGQIRFGKDGFAADDLGIQIDGRPAHFQLALGGFTADPTHAVEAQLRGNLPITSVLASFTALDSYWSYFPGTADWILGLTIATDEGGVGDAAKTLTLSSDLHGLAIELPAPLSKPAEQVLPLRATLRLPVQDGRLDVSLGELLHLQARLAGPQRALAAQVTFGEEKPEALPDAGILIHGEMPALDISGWLEFAKAGNDAESPPGKVDIKVAQLNVAGRYFRDIALKLTVGKDETAVVFQGEHLDGSLSVPTSNLAQRGITAQFRRLHMLDEENAANPTPVALGASPATIPPLHVSIDDLWLGQSHLGSARLESNPTPNGMRIEQFETHSPNVEMSARGDWDGRAALEHSHFTIDFSAQNLGHMLDALGYTGMIDGGATVVHIDAGWAGSPAAFALEKLEGVLKTTVAEGRILDVNPGAGRLFGLLSIAELPRRLALDFSDIFRSGLSFDSISGVFSLQDGNAHTNDLELKGPAADIRVRGRTGLRAKDYDQDMEVIPRVGNTLPIVGAIAGGPVGAAAGFIMQGILHRPLKEATRARYHIGGSWEKPVITLTAKETTKPRSKNEIISPAP